MYLSFQDNDYCYLPGNDNDLSSTLPYLELLLINSSQRSYYDFIVNLIETNCYKIT